MLPFLSEAGNGIIPVWSTLIRCTLKAAYTILQARNLHEERHEPAAMTKALMLSERTSGSLRLRNGILTATIHAGANDTFSRPPADRGDPCPARFIRPGGDMNAVPAAARNMLIVRGGVPKLTNTQLQNSRTDSATERYGCFSVILRKLCLNGFLQDHAKSITRRYRSTCPKPNGFRFT